MLPATIKTSTGRKVVDIICFATPVRSSKVTVLAKDVPLSIKIISWILSNASEKQLKGSKRRIETYISSIDRILSNRSID